MKPGASITAVPGALLLHVPPPVVLLNVVLPPTQRPRVPVSAAGAGFTVLTAVTKQPDASAYVIVVVPPDAPYRSPVPEIVPTDGVLLLHTPPGVVLDNVVVWNSHTVPAPVIADGRPFTVTTAVVIQPVDAVYVIVAVPVVVPAVQVPPDVIVAVPVALLLHVPPGVALLSVAD